MKIEYNSILSSQNRILAVVYELIIPCSDDKYYCDLMSFWINAYFRLIPYLAIFSLVVLFYLVPTWIAIIRRHDRRRAIFAANILLGCTIVGWIITLIWSIGNTKERIDFPCGEIDKNTYICKHVKPELEYYSRASKKNEYIYYGINIIIIVASAAIPIIVLIDKTQQILIAIIGFLVSVLNGIDGIYNFRGRMVGYNTTRGQLDRELALYEARSATGKGDDGFANFAEAVEKIKWSAYSNWNDWIGKSTQANNRSGQSDIG